MSVSREFHSRTLSIAADSALCLFDFASDAIDRLVDSVETAAKVYVRPANGILNEGRG